MPAWGSCGSTAYQSVLGHARCASGNLGARIGGIGKLDAGGGVGGHRRLGLGVATMATAGGTQFGSDAACGVLGGGGGGRGGMHPWPAGLCTVVWSCESGLIGEFGGWGGGGGLSLFIDSVSNEGRSAESVLTPLIDDGGGGGRGLTTHSNDNGVTGPSDGVGEIEGGAGILDGGGGSGGMHH